MLEIAITVILIAFFGLFFLMAVPLKDQAHKINQQESSGEKTNWQQS